MVVTVGTMEAEVGVTLVEAVRLVGAMMEGRGESTVAGCINMVEKSLQLVKRERGREAEKMRGQRSRTHITGGRFGWT